MSSSRQRYLDAMGIDIYLLNARDVADADDAEVSDEADGTTAADGATTATAADKITASAEAADVVKAAAPAAVTKKDGNRIEVLRALENEVSQCRLCPLCETRTQTVFGVGDPDADCMLVGEAPGAEEDRQGKPFIGRAGQLLVSMLYAIGMERDEVYITNVLKCRPPRNRDPGGTEVVTCEPYLHRQVELVAPRLIVAMGRFAAQSLLRTGDSISSLRGREFVYGDTEIPLLITYHPAYLLRNPVDKRKTWDDLLLIKNKLAAIRGGDTEAAK